MSLLGHEFAISTKNNQRIGKIFSIGKWYQLLFSIGKVRIATNNIGKLTEYIENCYYGNVLNILLLKYCNGHCILRDVTYTYTYV